jgi:sialate O-acetylesterase
MCVSAQGQPLQLNALFQDHAVLQREKPITVWGQAPAGETVTVLLEMVEPITPAVPTLVTLRETSAAPPSSQAGPATTPTPIVTSAQTQANADGRWSLALPALQAGGPYILTARTSSGVSQSTHDLLIGDVFLCSGQSNMEMSVLRAGDSEGEIKKPANDTIRWLNVEHATSATPLLTFASPVRWKKAAPDTVADWSAVCLFFARELQSTSHAPIGLIQSTWSGSNIRPWLSVATLHANGGYEAGLAVLAAYAKDPDAGQQQFADLWEQWWRSKTGNRPGAEPWRTQSPVAQWRTAPATLGDWRTYDVAELKTFTGMLWYRTQFTLTPTQAQSLQTKRAHRATATAPPSAAVPPTSVAPATAAMAPPAAALPLMTATLTLGNINQVDETWINGRAVGNTFGYGTLRTYQLPPRMLHAGVNTLVINVLSTYGEGGLLNGGPERAVHLPTGESIPLNGVWHYRVVPAKTGNPPRSPWESVGGLSTLYNAMIAPLGPYSLRGVLWYQGESNSSEANTYRGLLTGLMADWRRQLGPDLPFLIVQLPNYGALTATPAESDWADLREAQRLAVRGDTHAGLAVTIDVGEPRNLHPTNKQDVSLRLARAARRVIYGEAIPPSGPIPLRAVRNSEGVGVEFGDIDKGLVAYGHDEPIGFQLCTDSPGSCRFVDAELAGFQVKLTIPSGSTPTRVRYCWADSPICTLFDASGMPAGPFELRLQ